MTGLQWCGPSVLSGLKEQKGYCSRLHKTVDALINGFIAIGLFLLEMRVYVKNALMEERKKKKSFSHSISEAL